MPMQIKSIDVIYFILLYITLIFVTYKKIGVLS